MGQDTASQNIHGMDWRVNLVASVAAQFLCISGFSAVFPFLPFYIRDLGVPAHQVELWSGVIIAGGSVSMAIVSPIWGILSDRHGRKLMVLRATFGGAIVISLMACVSNVQQFFVLRILQGALTGTIPAFMTLTSSYAPPKRVGFALGLLQMAVYVGASMGPLFGGTIADHFGYRWAFLMTAGFLLFAGVLVVTLVHEKFERPSGKTHHNSIGDSARTILHTRAVLGAIVVMAGLYTAHTVIYPVLPLFVEKLHTDHNLVNTTTGTIFGLGAVASASASVLIGRLIDRTSHRPLLLVCSLCAALAYMGQALSQSIPPLMIASFVSGFCVGGIIPTANAVLARKVPKPQQGSVFGLSHSISSVGRAIGPLLGAGLATTLGLRASFMAGSFVFSLVAVWVLFMFAPGGAQDKPPSSPNR